MKFTCPEHGAFEKTDIQVAYAEPAQFCPARVHHGIANAFEIYVADNTMNVLARYQGRTDDA